MVKKHGTCTQRYPHSVPRSTRYLDQIAGLFPASVSHLCGGGGVRSSLYISCNKINCLPWCVADLILKGLILRTVLIILVTGWQTQLMTDVLHRFTSSLCLSVYYQRLNRSRESKSTMHPWSPSKHPREGTGALKLPFMSTPGLPNRTPARLSRMLPLNRCEENICETGRLLTQAKNKP